MSALLKQCAHVKKPCVVACRFDYTEYAICCYLRCLIEVLLLQYSSQISFPAIFGSAAMDQWCQLQESSWVYCYKWKCWMQMKSSAWVRIRNEDLEFLGGSAHVEPSPPLIIYSSYRVPSLHWGTLGIIFFI